jgi:hypothetical protein
VVHERNSKGIAFKMSGQFSLNISCTNLAYVGDHNEWYIWKEEEALIRLHKIYDKIRSNVFGGETVPNLTSVYGIYRVKLITIP